MARLELPTCRSVGPCPELPAVQGGGHFQLAYDPPRTCSSRERAAPRSSLAHSNIRDHGTSLRTPHLSRANCLNWPKSSAAGRSTLLIITIFGPATPNARISTFNGLSQSRSARLQFWSALDHRRLLRSTACLPTLHSALREGGSLSLLARQWPQPSPGTLTRRTSRTRPLMKCDNSPSRHRRQSYSYRMHIGRRLTVPRLSSSWNVPAPTIASTLVARTLHL